MDVICVNGLFSTDALIQYEKYGVEVPKQDNMYTIRDVIVNSNGQTGLLLAELINPKIPNVHTVGMVVSMEPNWNVNRFRMISGKELNLSEIKKEINQFIKSA